MSLSPYNRGLIAAIMAYAFWSLIPFYWKLLVGISAPELLYVRLTLTTLTCLLLLPFRGTFGTFLNAWKDPGMIRQRAFSAALLAGNWFSFMWSVTNDRVLESSLGYFLCPLVSVLLGRFVEKERLGRKQWTAVAMAATGVALIVLEADRFPIAAIAIAFTWSGYGLIKKRSRQGPLVGLGLESTILTPLALGLLLWTATRHPLTLTGVDPGTLLVLSLVGVITLIPLLLFAYAAQRIRLTTMGMGQYLVPSVFFLIALYYGEPVTRGVMAGFILIWTGLGLYSLSGNRRNAVDAVDRE